MSRLLISFCVFPAMGIAAFGAAIAHLAESAIWPGAVLWFCGGLLVYNVDRDIIDPSDVQNTPHRQPGRDRAVRRLFMLLAAGGLLWQAGAQLGMVILGAIACLAYSLPICGVRIKSLPAIKTLFPPLAITGAYALIAQIDHWWLLFWTFVVLLINVLLCDVRDREGDARHGTRTLAVLLGARTQAGLWALLTLALAISATLQPLLLAPTHIYLAILIMRGPQDSHAFYEWGVDGMLFVLPLSLAIMG